MKIPLNEFEQHIDEVILKRGLRYFKNGNVRQVDELSAGEYEAIVDGSETYTVRMEIKSGVMQSHYCTCPYDMGPVCKHEVAVLFYLQQDELGIQAKATKKKATTHSPIEGKISPPKSKRKTIQDKLNEILDILPPQELKSIIGELCDQDKTFRDTFLARHLYLIEPVSQNMYVKQIRAIINSLSGRSGYLDWSAAREVGQAIYQLSQLAAKDVQTGKYREVMYMGCAILEEMTKAIEQGDDSNGDLGGCISEAQDILHQVAEGCTDKAIRRELFSYCIDAFQQQKFKGWDWHFLMLGLAIKLIETDKDRQEIETLIDNVKPSGKSWDFDYEEAQRLKFALIKKTGSTDAVVQYLEANIGNSDFRRELIQRAIDDKQYTKAISLAEAGIIADEKEKPGLADEWRNFLLQIYEKQQDIPNCIQMAHYLFLNASRYDPKELFEKQKRYVAKSEWPSYFDQLVTERKKAKGWIGFHSIADMYIWEKQWEKLLDYLTDNASLDNMQYAESYLMKQFPEQLVDLYYTNIKAYLQNSIGREYYQAACRFIRRMIKLGGRDKANVLIAELRKQYPQRRALLEELNKV